MSSTFSRGDGGGERGEFALEAGCFKSYSSFMEKTAYMERVALPSAARWIPEFFEIPNPETLGVLIEQSPTIVGTLKEGRAQIIRHFGGGVKARLRLQGDPEFEDHARVIVEIVASSGVADALRSMGQFDALWWADAAALESADVCFLVVAA
jgi:hypothetical protein